ncbi:Carbohydrate sulfotransferase 11 [Armadillidium vulgare]|nr:Carbohydrate sulfotransferase 11 [Armadillidium vulgare]
MILTPIRVGRYVIVLFILTTGITFVIHTGSRKKEIVPVKDLAKEITRADRIKESKILEKKADGDNSFDENYINSLQNQDKKINYVSSQVQNDVLKFSNYVKKSCEENLNSGRIKKSSLNSWEFLINHEFKLVYCPIFKSASSTWIFYFLRMKGVRVHDLNVARNGPNHYIESTSNDYFNPFICNISKSRKDAFGNCRATFPDFVDFLISEQEKGRQPNEHWATYDEFCSPCQVRFDYVLKFEHLDVEEPFFLSQIPGLTSVLKENIVLHSSKTNYELILSSYFSQLSPYFILR